MKKVNSCQLDAYREVLLGLARKHRQVMEAFIDLGGQATLFEICDHLKLQAHMVSGRITELRNMGALVDSGKVKINPKSLKNGTVWKLKN
jgi:hypothetical protein